MFQNCFKHQRHLLKVFILLMIANVVIWLYGPLTAPCTSVRIGVASVNSNKHEECKPTSSQTDLDRSNKGDQFGQLPAGHMPGDSGANTSIGSPHAAGLNPPDEDDIPLFHRPLGNVTSGSTSSRQHLKTFYSETFVRQPVPKILLWTRPYDNNTRWYRKLVKTMPQCSAKCEISYDHKDLEKADAVVFHRLYLTWDLRKYPFPTYRRRDQAWILFISESYKNTVHNISRLNGVFNWTTSFQSNSEAWIPYGEVTPLSPAEKEQAALNVSRTDFLAGKQNLSIAMISNCYDLSKRLQLIEELQKFMKVDVVGHCKLKNTGHKSDKQLRTYKFYLALENSLCKEYVTEKFWNAIRREQIPIVHWNSSMDHFVPPKSYINTNDFPNVESAAKYILKVAENKTLYNSYFQWKKHYKLGGYPYPSICRACRLLKNTSFPAMTYHKLDAWYKDDNCKPGFVRDK